MTFLNVGRINRWHLGVISAYQAYYRCAVARRRTAAGIRSRKQHSPNLRICRVTVANRAAATSQIIQGRHDSTTASFGETTIGREMLECRFSFHFKTSSTRMPQTFVNAAYSDFCPYLEVVKIPLKFLDPDCNPDQHQSRFFLLVRHPILRKFHKNS